MSYGTYAPSRFQFGYRMTPWVKRLLVANLLVYIIMLLVGAGGREFIFTWFSFTPAEILTRPWGALTYMFIHGGFWHLFVNMLVLFFFGPPLEQKWGSNEFIKYYLICGLGGVLLSFLFVASPIVGASAAIYGVMLAFAMAWPEAPIYVWGILPVKAKWLVGFFFIITFFSAFGDAGGGIAHMAHLGGLLTGLIYLKSDWRLAASLDRIREATKARRFAVVSRDEANGEEDDQKQRGRSGSRRRSARSRKSEEELLDQVDEILDKISSSGIGSLTSEERRILDEVSKRRRSN